MKKGDIVLLPFPFTVLSGSKNRPALVLISMLNDITVYFISSNVLSHFDTDISLIPTPHNGLKNPSLLETNKIATIDRKLVLGILGELLPNELALLDINLKKVLQLS